MGKRTKLWQRWLSLVLAIYMALSNVPISALAQESEKEPETLAGKTISILGDSISTFQNVSNNTCYNSTIGSNAVYYSAGTLGVYRADTWWQQTIDALDLQLLVNNSWSGSCILHTRSGTVGAYVDRCVNLHNDITGEEPDIIAVFLGTNDFSYYQSALGTADIDYDTLITENTDGTYTYATPTTSCEAYAIMLHKMTERYPEAEIYCMSLLPRRESDYTGDSVTDVGAPTAFNAELANVIEHFGATLVDLENCGITPEISNFDQYIGDKRVHPGPAGMDMMTQALIDALVGKENASFTVTYDLANVTADAKDSIVLGGGAFAAKLTAAAGFADMHVTVTMGGVDVTDRVYANGKVTIPAITGDVVITATAEIDDIPDNYRWQMQDNALVSTGEAENALTKKAGSVTDGVLKNAYYQLEKPVVLRHDRPWVVEWKASGNWSGMLLSANASSSAEGNSYLFKTTTSTGFMGFGERVGSSFENYGIALVSLGIDTTAEHTYRVENRIAADGTNMACLWVDGAEQGALNNFFIGGDSDQKKTVDWLNGRDLCFFYVGSSGHPINNCKLEYLSVWEGGIQEEDTSFAFTVTPENYVTISGDETEKLACAPGLVTYGDGKFAVSYLADETNTVETESSTTIVCRLGLFDVDDPENGTFFDIATAGQTIGGVTIGSKAPYEPNLLKLSDRELLVLFNIRDTSGNYVYYSAKFDTASNTVTAYQPLTLDGKSWTPANIAASYNALAETDISTSGPAGSMVFTSQIIQHEGYYYGYCGGICAGFSGILVRSTDGIHWTSVMVPEAASDMAGVIECGFQFLDNYVYFCMRDISSGVYHCSYDFTTGEQLVKTRKIPGLTTSKPTAFAQDGKLYVIVNKATGDDNTVGRRNTALFYRVDPETCRLSLARQVFCADGIAYHSVVNCNGTNYWCFHTDARRINPYTQGRSNLAFRKIPALYAAESGSNDGVLDLDDYNHMYASGCITAATNTWQSGVVNMHYQIPLADFAGYDHVTITANGEQKAYIAFFADWMTQAGTVAYADGWTEQLILDPGTSRTLPIPEDAQYLYILNNNAAGANLLPESVVFSKGVESLTLRYDDRYDVTGKTVEILDAGKPSSWQVGYGVEENKVPDTAVVTGEGNSLVATGIGTATVRIDGTVYEITVEAAPISLLLLAGQSNMQGIDGDPKQSVVCPEGMVYATYADRYKKTVADVTKFAPSALSGEHSDVNVTGDTACLENYPVYMLTAPGNGREGMDSGLAYEWVRQTGEKVWVVNLGYGGSSINGWLEGGEHYHATLALLSACQETLRKEIAAGHFTLSHMGYFWCQGCADETQTAQWYADKYQTMHGLFKSSLTFDHDSNTGTPEKAMEFGGIIPIRSGHAGFGSYRAGVYKDTTSASYYQSFKDLRFNGPRVAQYWMGNNPALTDIWNVCTIQEDWATLPDGTDGVADYFRSAYENGKVDYPVQVAQSASWYTPTTPAAVHDNIHYNQIGYNELGRESARNALILLGETQAPKAEATVEFIGWDGFTPVAELTASITGNADTLVVPMVSPVWKSKEVTYDLSDGLTYSYYDLLTRDQKTKGTLTAIGAEGGVTVTGMRELTAYNWTFDGSNLVSSPGEDFTDNPLSLLGGKVENGIFNNARYGLKKSIRLFHDQTWGLEIQLSNWTGTEGSMIFGTGPDAAVGQPYLYFRPADSFVGFGCYDGSSYHNYGISLKNHNVACNEGSHTYRFLNRILEDGTNQIWLFVDDREIGPLTEHYTNSTLSDTGNNWLSGKDFDLSNIGTGGWPIRGCTLNAIRAAETNYDPNAHFHSWSDWQQITAPGPEGPGLEQRSCACGETDSREVEGVWQTHELSKYLQTLPEDYCAGTNLWTVLPHTQTYYYGGTHWAPNTGADVWAVTIPVEPGDKIFATAFGKAGDNGYTSNGIRCTFFDAEGVCKTTGPAETYTEFTANGGYLIAPEGAVAVNVPMYGDKDTYELYILNAEHSYENGVCTLCGEEKTGICTDLTHIVAYGQSFSVGGDAPIYGDPAVDGVYVLGGITDSNGDTLTSIPATGTQHPIISAVNALSKLLSGDGIDTDIIVGSYGAGGKTIAQLMSQERQGQIKAEEGYTYDILSSGRYGVFQSSVAAVADYARENGKTVSCPAIVYLQGETDQNTDAQLGYPDNPQWAAYAAGGDKEKYKEYMSRLKEDMQREVMEAYGQTEKPLFLIYQISGTYVRTNDSAINMAQLEFAQENEDVILVQTPYFTPHYTNSHHLTVNGYRWLGEYIGQTMHTALTKQTKTWPMLPQKFVWEDTKTLRITVSGAVNGLTIDTWTVEDATNSGNKYGFYLVSNGKTVVPKTVDVEGNDIVLTFLDGAITLEEEGTVSVYYGGRGAKGTGNIRDNATKTGFYCYLDDSADTGTGNNQGVSHSALDENGNSIIGQPYPLYNWLASFCQEIEAPVAEKKAPASYYWEMQESGLVSVTEGQAEENELTLLQGSVENGILKNAQYSMEKSVVLYHDRPWTIEWKASGNGSSYGGGKIFSASQDSGSSVRYLYLPADSRGFLAWGVASEGRNYGIKLGQLGIDTRQEHVYRIENRIAEDGTNTVYLIVDGVEIGDMNTPYSTKDGSLIDDAKNWANGTDIYLDFLGEPTNFLLNNMKLSYLRILEDSHEHTYENGVCTLCGEVHPNLANYKGKVISILGDSISTFAGYIPVADGFNLEHYARYPQDNLLTDVNETWWMQVIDTLDAKLGINDSWRSTEVYNYIDAEVNDTYDGTKACMASTIRIQNLGSNGTPDVILFFGGTNDITQSRPLGTFDPALAPTEVDLISVKWETVADAYVDAIMRMQYYYPDAQIIAMLPFDRNSQGTAKVNKYNSLFISICEHYGVPYTDLRECGITNADLPDGTHPDAKGMDDITEAVLNALLVDCDVAAGEHIVHSVTHDLTDAKSSLSYYKGVSHGKPFKTTVTGENLKVTVTMGGADITANCYANGVISIGNVTGDLVITATGTPKTVYADYLQELPEKICSGTNLWTALKPINLYYTGSGWGNTGSGSVYSVTIPISAGDQIWATSFQKSGTNGGNRNGIRLTWFDENGVLESISPDDVYAEFSANAFVTAPEGTAAVNVVMWNGNESNEVYLLNRDHTYENGSCTLCGEAHPNLANYKEKVISVLGDSISTFAGYIPVADGFNLEHLPRYPQDNLLTDVNETWWMQVIDRLDAKLGINDSWRSATVSGAHAVTTGSTGENASMANLTRQQNLGSNGKPDVILFYGGTNDLAHVSKVGTFDPATAPTTVDLTTKKWDNLADGYVHTLLRLRHYYPDALVLAMLPTVTTSYYSNEKLAQANAVLADICDHYGVPYVDLRNCGLTTADLPDGIHPDAKGMDFITEAVLGALLDAEMEAGENVVYSVKHDLADVTASLGHYKGISAGESFEETIRGDGLTVTVTMGGMDITASAYADGKITIPAVTGDLVITARGEFTADGHLQQLPEPICAGTNLWTALSHDEEYYTVSGWGVHNSGKVFSVTFPVSSGDEIFATSFGKAGENGTSINGIRVTWFLENGKVSSVGADAVHTEFAAKGFLTAPEGAIAVCVPMWTPDDTNELYLLNREHRYGYAVEQEPGLTEAGILTGTCEICGGETTVELPILSEEAYDYAVTAEPTYTETGMATYTWKDTTYGTFTFEVVLDMVPILYGDVDGNGTVNTRDRILLTRYLAGWEGYDEEDINLLAADVNQDGTVNTKDRIILSRYLANWTGYEELPYKK